jgi:hypothetical protein
VLEIFSGIPSHTAVSHFSITTTESEGSDCIIDSLSMVLLLGHLSSHTIKEYEELSSCLLR